MNDDLDKPSHRRISRRRMLQVSAAATAAGVDTTKIAAMNADITAQTATLAAAVLQGTPVPPAPGPGVATVTAGAATAMANKAVADAKRK